MPKVKGKDAKVKKRKVLRQHDESADEPDAFEEFFIKRKYAERACKGLYVKVCRKSM